MGILHTGFGVGSVLGPLVATALLASGASWRVAFGSLSLADLILALVFMGVIGALDRTSTRHEDRPSSRGRRLLVALSVAVFFFYAGVAVGAGAWSFVFLTEHRGVGVTAAGVAVAAFWAAFTLSRFVLGIVGDRVVPDPSLTVSGAVSVASLAVLWMAAEPWMSIGALVVLGLAQGWVAPLEMMLTARRFGDRYTPWVVGYEIAGLNVGVMLLLGGVGFLVAEFGVGMIAPALFGLAVSLLAAMEGLRFLARRRGAVSS